MSATEWITASQVTRSLCGSRTASVSGVSAGSSSHASGRPCHDSPVERGVGHGVDGRPAVLALEVDRVDGARGGELLDQLVRPVGRRVELEPRRRDSARARRAGAPSSRARRGASRRRTSAAGRAADRVSERAACLAEREVEGGALERPAAVVEVRVLLGLVVEERQRREVLRERVERPLAAQRQHGPERLLEVVLGGA